jgi:hypothetical protein
MHAFTIPPLWYAALAFLIAVSALGFVQAWRKRSSKLHAAWWAGLGFVFGIPAVLAAMLIGVLT